VAKNQLSAADAQQVEEAFAAKLALVHPQNASVDDQGITEKTGISEVDKRILAFPEPRRIRDRDHIRHVIKQACLICGRRPSDPHHLRFAQSRALGRKVSDEFTVPLCRAHHREVHRCGDEGLWWQKTGIDPLQLPARSGLKPIRCREQRLPSRATRQRATDDITNLSCSIIVKPRSSSGSSETPGTLSRERNKSEQDECCDAGLTKTLSRSSSGYRLRYFGVRRSIVL
jgi:hypothetical protein